MILKESTNIHEEFTNIITENIYYIYIKYL